MRALAQLAARLYGERLFHLIVVLAALALGACAISVLGVGNLFNTSVWWQTIAVWFAVAVIGHDLILFPLYTLADLAAAAGRPHPGSAVVSSLERFGAFNHAVLQTNQILDDDAMLALQVNGADLSLDHGYPARIIVPALPGVHNTKWVSSIDFRGI